LDYVSARNVARQACLRAACFLGFGLNSARDSRLNDFSLSKEVNLDLLPKDLTLESIDSMKNSFEKWIIANGLREMIEGFDYFLYRMYVLSLMADKNKPTSDSSIKHLLRQIKNKGLPGKQLALKNDFGIVSDFSQHLKTIYEARNCFAHSRGMVTEGFFNDRRTLRVTWRIIEILMIREDGTEEVILNEPNSPPIAGPGTLAARPTTRTRIFTEGQFVSFSVKELSEICVFAYLACDDFFMKALDFAKANGVISPRGS
jgi:hypothetical protein